MKSSDHGSGVRLRMECCLQGSCPGQAQGCSGHEVWLPVSVTLDFPHCSSLPPSWVLPGGELIKIPGVKSELLSSPAGGRQASEGFLCCHSARVIPMNCFFLPDPLSFPFYSECPFSFIQTCLSQTLPLTFW